MEMQKESMEVQDKPSWDLCHFASVVYNTGTAAFLKRPFKTGWSFNHFKKW